MQTSVPLMRQLLRASQERQAAAAAVAGDARARLLARLQVARRRQERWEASELSHGTERWQQQQVVLHEVDLARRDAASSIAASQERQVARLWMKLQRHLTHPRAPWAPAPSAEAEVEAEVYKLDKSENALRQRCRLRRVEGGTRHPEASISQKFAEAEQPPQGSEATAARPQPATVSGGSGIALLPSGVPLAKLCEGSDGEDWEESERKADKRLRASPGAAAGAEAEALAPLAPPSAPSTQVEEAREAEEARRQLKLELKCELVTAQRVVAGTLLLTATKLTFVPDPKKAEAEAAEELARWERRRRGERPPDRLPKEKEWSLSGVHEVHKRRYLLRASALELFFRETPAVFLNLLTRPRRRKLLSKLQSACPHSLQVVDPRDRHWVTELVARWQSRQISNFEYLMRLNTLAGRTYNDLNQYPVFPWVLRDYTSAALDLSDPASFRDLSKPMGAQRPERAREIAERYEQLKELQDSEQPPPFHYGSHYSSASIVLYYMIRLEPFTTLAVRLQGGFFDHADRLFYSLGSTYHNATTSSADVKELLPDLFYNAELLRNANRLDLGTRQDGIALHDVQLPPWAKDPYDFVCKHREALESDHVSAHLHEWVDLIFGYKQRERAAEGALNVFYHLTYEGAVDLDAISDARERAATESQINNFGNTPSQLLDRPHVARAAPGSPHAKSATSLITAPTQARLYFNRPIADAALLAVAASADRLVTVAADRHVSSHRWLPHAPLEAGTAPPFHIDPARALRLGFGVPFAGDQRHATTRFAASSDGRLLYSCGYWDHSLKATQLTDGRSAQSLRAHTDVVRCLCL